MYDVTYRYLWLV